MTTPLRMQLRDQLLILCAGLAVFFVGLGSARLWDEDEAEYSRCAREMMAGGDWVAPTFNHQLWAEKPVFVYWLMIGAFRMFGPTEFAARFPSAVFAVGTSLLTYHLGRRLFSRAVGFWAGLMLATTILFVVIGRAATLDSTMIFFTTLALLMFCIVARIGLNRPIGDASAPPTAADRFRALLPQTWRGFLAVYAALGMAVLVKGPIGVVMPMVGLGLYVLLAGRNAKRSLLADFSARAGSVSDGVIPGRRRNSVANASGSSTVAWLRQMHADIHAAAWSMRPFTLAAIVAVIALPWYAWVGIRTNGEYWRVFFWEHNIQYLLHSNQGHHGTVFYYLIATPVGFFPWTLAMAMGLAGAVRSIRRGESDARIYLLMICWSLGWIGVFTLCGTKLPHYAAPAFPALAVVAAKWLADWIAAPQLAAAGRRIARSWYVVGAIGVAMAIGVPVLVARAAPGAPSGYWVGLILVAGAVAGWWLQRRGRPAAAMGALTIAMIGMCIGLFGFVAAPFSEQQTSLRMSRYIERFGGRTTPVGTFRIFVPGLVYYADRPEPIHGLKTPEDFAQMCDGAGEFLVITDPEGYAEIRPQLPADTVVLRREPRFYKSGEVLLLGRQSVQIADRDAAITSRKR